MVIFLDSGDWRLFSKHEVSGYTTNPTLIKQSGIASSIFFKDAVRAARGKPISLEVFADDLDEMEEQATRLAALGPNVYVKIPITDTKGELTVDLIKKLSRKGLLLNITAITTEEQIRYATGFLDHRTPAIVSVFCGRIADTGRDPVPFIKLAVRHKYTQTKVLWASTREVFNIHQARQAGADIITVPLPILEKYLAQNGRDLERVSLDTVNQFYEDSKGIQF